MTRVSKRIVICGSLLVLLATVHYLLYGAAAEGEAAHNSLWAKFAGITMARWTSLGILATALVIVVHLCLVASRLRRDMENLRNNIQRMTSLEASVTPNDFAYQELYECATELSSVAGWLRSEQGRLTDFASRDPLTGLANRRFLMDTLDREIAAARRTNWPLAFVMVDLDHFKKLNDTHGHQAGDLALKRAAERLASLVRHADLVARFGGEEFAIVLPRASLKEATDLAQELRNALRCTVVEYENKQIQLTASFGVAEFHTVRAEDAGALVREADEALYRAKKNGRDCVMAAESCPDRPQPPIAQLPGAVDDAQSSDDEEAVESVIDPDTMALMGSTFSLLQVIPDKHRVAHDTVQQVASAIHAHRVVLFMQRRGTPSLHVVASVGVAMYEAEVYEQPSNELAAWFADIRRRHPLRLEESIQTAQAGTDDGGRQLYRVRVPLIANDNLIGALEADGIREADLSKRQRSLLSAICLIGATGINICETFMRLEDRWTTMLETMCRVMQTEDRHKRDHATRVSALAVELAREMGQTNAEELRLLRVGGLLHDIGAASISKRIWQKRRKLSNRERRMMQEHTRLGAEIIRDVTHMDRLSRIVLHHHESFDGTGYPDGLSGESIPLESRILCVADAFVAITSSRPYRPAATEADAIAELRAGAGRQFDPHVVEACEAYLARVSAQSRGRSLVPGSEGARPAITA